MAQANPKIVFSRYFRIGAASGSVRRLDFVFVVSRAMTSYFPFSLHAITVC